jgi:hypothetical protein
MIVAEIYQSGSVRRSWKFRFIGANNKKFGHQYNDADNAREAITTLLSSNIGVTLRIRNDDGSVTDLGRIR